MSHLLHNHPIIVLSFGDLGFEYLKKEECCLFLACLCNGGGKDTAMGKVRERQGDKILEICRAKCGNVYTVARD